jgi:hypothetical protein
MLQCLALVMGIACLARAEDPSPKAAVIASATEVARQWQPHQRLYVKGNLGLSASQLDALEQWLDTNATNWVVVLLESAANETYTDAEGARHNGIEAVNHALGKGLMNQTTFGEARDPRTQEPNAAIFVLALKDRRLSYFGSDAQDRRGLGEERWVGNLDQPAIAAMRSGGRVVDATKDTITGINRRLDQAIKAEANARERRAAEERASRERTEQQARAEMQSATETLNRFATRAGEFAARHPEATGDLARPDLPKLRAQLEIASQALQSARYSEARSAAEEIRPVVETALRALDQHDADAARLERAGARHQQVAQHSRAGAVQQQLASAARALEQALVEHRRADSSYLGHLGEAEQALNLADARLAAAEREARIRRTLILAGTGYAVAVLTIVGLVMNRRRAKTKREAEELCASWEHGLSEKTDALFKLLDRRGIVVGSSAPEAARRYAGDTLKLARQIIQDVDELFIMSACVSRVLTDSQAQLHPRDVRGRFSGLFLKRRYERALRLLRDEPVAFRPDEGLELIVRGARTERDRLLGKLEDYQPFRMTFTKLIEAFNRYASRAVENLDRIESSVRNVAAHITATEDAVATARGALDSLGSGAADGLLRLNEARGGLLPAAESTLAEARNLAAVDPVGAEAGPALRARQQAEDARGIIAIGAQARTEHLPRLEQAAAELAANGVSSAWIGVECARLSAQADALAEAARGAVQTEAIQSYASAWEALTQRVAKALELDDQRRGTATTAVGEAEAEIVRNRNELGASLGVPTERVLRESETDPSSHAAKARDQLASAHAALERGDIAAAENALSAAAEVVQAIHRILGATRESFTAHANDMAALREESARLSSLLPEHRELLHHLRAGYAPAVLLLGAGDATHPNANGTVADNLAEAERHLAQARELIEIAEESFQNARLLESARLRGNVAAQHESAQSRLDEIREKRSRLAAVEVSNTEKLALAETKLSEGQRLADAPTTMRATQSRFQAAAERLATVRPEVGTAGGDPFAAAEALDEILRELDAVADQARCDRDIFEEAERSVKAANSQLTEARMAASQTAGDNIPDSASITSATGGLPELSARLAELQTALRQPHQDWGRVDGDADRLTNDAARITATLRGELTRAQSALAALSGAAAAVRGAGGWTGGFGVLILGSPGSDTLEGARAWLQRGDYERARSNAETARRVAEAAIAQAAAEVERRRQEEFARREREHQRRVAEAAARAARAARRSGGGGFGGFGGFGGGSGGGFSGFGGGGGSSWGSSGSGFGGSSFGGGGSGFKTSGW